jgi:hypothetical protein
MEVMMRTSDELRVVIAAATGELQEFRASVQSALLLHLYDALIESHLLDLATVAPEALAFRQGALRQLQCLRAVLVDANPHLSAKA